MGEFTQASTIAARQIARWDGGQWHALGNGSDPRFRNEFGISDGTLYADATAPNGDVYVGGNFNLIDDVSANGVARWDGTAWHALGAGLTDRGIRDGEERFLAWVYALVVAPDDSVYAGGQFSDAGDVLARNIARWDSEEWQALGAGVSDDTIFDDRVHTIPIDGAKIYVGGLFTSAGRVAVSNIAQWNGQEWQALDAGLSSELDSPPPVLALSIKDGALYAGGTFTNADHVLEVGSE